MRGGGRISLSIVGGEARSFAWKRPEGVLGVFYAILKQGGGCLAAFFVFRRDSVFQISSLMAQGESGNEGAGHVPGKSVNLWRGPLLA